MSKSTISTFDLFQMFPDAESVPSCVTCVKRIYGRSLAV